MFNNDLFLEIFRDIFGEDMFFTKNTQNTNKKVDEEDNDYCDEECCNDCCCDCYDDEDNDEDYCKEEDNKQVTIVDLLKEFSDYLTEYVKMEKERQEKEKKEKEQKIPKRPSESIPTEIGLQIHKLTNRYCDEYIRSRFDTKISNDIYAGLYEFACWIYNQDKIE